MLVDHMVFTNSMERTLTNKMEGNADAVRRLAEHIAVRLETLNHQIIAARPRPSLEGEDQVRTSHSTNCLRTQALFDVFAMAVESHMQNNAQTCTNLSDVQPLQPRICTSIK